MAADAYNLELMSPSNEGYDAITKNGKKVEIKATQSNRVAFRSCPEHAIIIKINKDGTFVECFNGPGHLIWDVFSNKKIPKNGQYQISINRVKKLHKTVPNSERVPKAR